MTDYSDLHSSEELRRDREGLVDILLVRWSRASIDEQSAILGRLVRRDPLGFSDVLSDVLDREVSR